MAKSFINEYEGLILAAGYGTRLRPYTNYIPKPLLPFCGSPIIKHAISRLSNKLGREPRDFEIANELGVDIDKYHQMLNDSSSSQMIGIEDLGVSADVIAEGGDNTKDKLFDTLATSKFKVSLVEAIKKLPEREQQVLSFGQGI